MTHIRDLPPPAREAVLALVQGLKHDIGRYAAFQTRWTADDASLDDRREALLADVFATRRGADGQQDVFSVFAPFGRALSGQGPAPHLVDLRDDPAVAEVFAAIEAVRGLAGALSPAADEAIVARGRVAVLAVSDACSALYKRCGVD